ncbi:MAG: FtsX-like permease family protein, partial [Deltaproteobacteria bacterium]|nr:FtsX-like permease family protein [Deltaproteobacteria bacterium]
YIENFLPAGRNMALILNEEGGAPGFAFLIGVDYAHYKETFPNNMVPIEGRLLRKDERGAIVPTGARKQFYDYTGLWFIPVGVTFNEENFRKETKEELEDEDLTIKDSIVFLGYNEKNTTLDIRLDIKGIVKFKALNTIFGHFNFVDIESYRECQGYFPAALKTVTIPEEKRKFLEMKNENIDKLFTEGSLFSESIGDEIEEVIKISPREWIQGEKKGDIEAGTYNVIFVRLSEGVSLPEGLKKLNAMLKDEHLGVRAVSWKKAFGLLGSMATIIKGALFGFVMLLFVVAIIIIVNTLTMATLERTSEIGMMRAVGARKSFIGNMFLGETAILSFVFGGVGIITGIIAIRIVPLLHITSSNDMVQLLFGGDTFFPVLSFQGIIITIFQLVLVTLIAVVYPMKIAREITPLEAIVRD